MSILPADECSCHPFSSFLCDARQIAWDDHRAEMAGDVEREVRHG